MTVPTTGIKFSGRYMTYLTRAFGVNFSNGDFNNFPSLPIGSLKLPALSCLPSETMAVWFRESRTPSNVSRCASCSRKVRDMILIKVELSLKVKRMVVRAANGPLKNTRTASCGRYVNMNINETTPIERVVVGASFESIGFHKQR